MSNESFRTEVLLRSEQSNCQVAVIENTVLAGWDGPPLAAAECLHFYEGFCTGWFDALDAGLKAEDITATQSDEKRGRPTHELWALSASW
jgi:hypothetical protein